MPIIDNSDKRVPVKHKRVEHGLEVECPICLFRTHWAVAFIQHMWLKHRRRSNPTTGLWEYVK